ncbi:MAG: hypothetical protein QM831_03305 [Kofleriaceae bacterium]
MKLAALLIALSACSQHLYSPPTQAFALAPVNTLAPTDKALDVDLSTHSQIFDPGYDQGTGRLRYGITPTAELSIEGAAATVEGSIGPANHEVYSTRAGVRWQPSKGPLSLNAGFGGGFAPAAGTFAAVDAGAQIGYDNCYFVPLAAVSTFISQPLQAKAVDVGDDGVSVDGMPPSEVYSTPHRTGGGTIRFGARIPMLHADCHAGKQVPTFTAGFDVTSVVDSTEHAEMMGVGIGITLPL